SILNVRSLCHHRSAIHGLSSDHQRSSTQSSTFVHSVTTARPSMASPAIINVRSLRHQRSAIHGLNDSAIRFNSVRPTSLIIDVRFQAFGISFA
ncbi:hypothetical protein VIGAN_08102700, partial [Vigna angularis var. angularis]